MNCAPSKDYINGSCFSYEDLQTIALTLNEKMNLKIDIALDKPRLLYEISKVFKSCNNQMCWLENKVLKNLPNDILNNTFRPVGPKNSSTWLNTNDINNVMNQYTYSYPNFKFMGALPYDFYTYYSHIRTFSFLKPEKTIYGFIINLDKHYQSGSHWVALYINLTTMVVYYFDSVGKKPGKAIKKFIYDFLQYVKVYYDINTDKFIAKYNTTKHQKENTECGVYAMNFLIKLLHGVSFKKIVNSKNLSDINIRKCRKEYFN